MTTPIQSAQQKTPIPLDQKPKSIRNVPDFVAIIKDYWNEVSQWIDFNSINQSMDPDKYAHPETIHKKQNVSRIWGAASGVGLVGSAYSMYSSDEALNKGMNFLFALVCANVVRNCYNSYFAPVDYERPEVLVKARVLAEKDPLDVTVNKHGWEITLKYDLLQGAEKLKKSFERAADQMTSIQLNDFFASGKAAIDTFNRANPESKFEIPHPSRWKNKFFEETKNMNLSEIFEKYSKDLKRLEEFKILTSESYNLVIEAGKVLSEERDTMSWFYEKRKELILGELEINLTEANQKVEKSQRISDAFAKERAELNEFVQKEKTEKGAGYTPSKEIQDKQGQLLIDYESSLKTLSSAKSERDKIQEEKVSLQKSIDGKSFEDPKDTSYPELISGRNAKLRIIELKQEELQTRYNELNKDFVIKA